jgi:hypothetical protein
MRRSDQPSRPNAITCCFLSLLKTLPIPTVASGTRLRRWHMARLGFVVHEPVERRVWSRLTIQLTGMRLAVRSATTSGVLIRHAALPLAVPDPLIMENRPDVGRPPNKIIDFARSGQRNETVCSLKVRTRQIERSAAGRHHVSIDAVGKRLTCFRMEYLTGERGDSIPDYAELWLGHDGSTHNMPKRQPPGESRRRPPSQGRPAGSDQIPVAALRDESCALFVDAAAGEQRLAVLENHHVPAGADLRIVPELSALLAAVVLQAPDLFAGLGLPWRRRPAVWRVEGDFVAHGTSVGSRSAGYGDTLGMCSTSRCRWCVWPNHSTTPIGCSS